MTKLDTPHDQIRMVPSAFEMATTESRAFLDTAVAAVPGSATLDDVRVAIADASLSLSVFHGPLRGEHADETYAIGTESRVFFVDIRHGQVAGFAEIEFDRVLGSERPFVGWTKSLVEKQGLGTERLRRMNQYCARFGTVLHSGRWFDDVSAEHVWQRLVADGEAVHEDDGSYHFTKQAV